MCQIPNGSIPLGTSKYINTLTFPIESYKSLSYKMNFYFPAEGDFIQQPSNISVDRVIVAKSEIYNLKVVSKHVLNIENAQTFSDIMLVAKTDEERKTIILDIFAKQIFRLNDPDFQFKSIDVQYFC